jgi:hypothetical protein
MDPVEIARQAGTRPPFPDLDQIGPQEATPVAAYQAPAATAGHAARLHHERDVDPGRTGRGTRDSRGD